MLQRSSSFRSSSRWSHGVVWSCLSSSEWENAFGSLMAWTPIWILKLKNWGCMQIHIAIGTHSPNLRIILGVLTDACLFRGSSVNPILGMSQSPTLWHSHTCQRHFVSVGLLRKMPRFKKLPNRRGWGRDTTSSPSQSRPWAQWTRMGLFFVGDLQAAIGNNGWPPWNQFPSSKGICNTPTLQCHCLSISSFKELKDVETLTEV